MELNYVLIRDNEVIGHVLDAEVSEDYKIVQSLQGVEYREIPAVLLGDAHQLILDGTELKIDQVRKDKENQGKAVRDRLNGLDLQIPLNLGELNQTVRDLVRMLKGKE